MAVDDQVDRPVGVGHQLAAELDEPGAGEAAGVGGEPQQALARSPRRSCSGCAGRRWPSPPGSARPGPRWCRRGSPSGSRPRRRSRSSPPRPWPGLRIAGNSSSRHRCTASGSACQARHSGRCGDNPRVRSSRPTLTADSDTRNSRRISSRTRSRVHNANPNSQLPRIRARDQRVQPAHLLTGQLRRPTRHRPRLQRVPAALPVLRQPPVDRAPAHAQRRRDILRVHPRLDRVHRPQPHRLERLVIQLAAVVLAHTALLQNQKIKSAYLRSCW